MSALFFFALAMRDADQMTVNLVTKEATGLFQREGCRCRRGIHNCGWLHDGCSYGCSCLAHLVSFYVVHHPAQETSRTQSIFGAVVREESQCPSALSKRAILAGNTWHQATPSSRISPDLDLGCSFTYKHVDRARVRLNSYVLSRYTSSLLFRMTSASSGNQMLPLLY